MDVILTHTNADFDSLGAMIGAKHLNPRAVIALPAALNANVRRFVGLYRDAFGMVDFAALDPAEIERVVLVDAQDPARAGHVQPLLERAAVAWEILDHHPPGDRPLPPGPHEIRPVGAATTLLATRLRRAGEALSAPEATGMLLGILEDTGRLTYPRTTPEDAEAIAYLLQQGARLDLVADYLETPLSALQAELLTEVLARLETLELAGGPALLVGLDHPHAVEGQSLVLERLVSLYRPMLAVMVVRTGTHTQIAARSRPGLDLRALLAEWGAQGHAEAASAHLETGVAPAELLERVRARLAALSPAGPVARELMSAPVRTLGFETTASEALEAMRQWGHTAMPVVHQGRVQGVLSRRDVDRAIHHGFGDRSIKGMVARRVEAVAPDTPLAAIRERMTEMDIGRLLVLDQGRLVGIVTRSDLIRTLDRLDRTPRPAAAPHDLAERLRAMWPADWQDVLHQVGRIAGDRPTYLIGGAVRDLLLERPSFDIDLMVEGDAIALARDLAAELGARLKVHEAFGTAHVTMPTGKRLDLATARVEHYPYPGSLPVVSPSTVRQDLSRRDFTINALAMRINPEAFGELLDFFGGVRDLRERVLRVLHPISFIEDPVRLFRAVRFETKLGLRMDPVTEAYGRYAMESGRFDGMAGERLKLELRLGLGLSRVAGLVERLDDLDAWRMLHSELRLSPATRRALCRLDRWQRFRADGDRWVVSLALLLRELPEAAREEAIAPLHLNRDERATLVACWEGTSRLARESEEWERLSEAELARRLSGLPDAALWAIASMAPSARIWRRLRRYATVLRDLRLERVDGAWLRAQGVPPGPVYGDVLAALLDAKRAGELATPEAEEARARDLLRERGQSV